MDAPFCRCNCGAPVTMGRRGWNAFVNGHHNRMKTSLDRERADTKATRSPSTIDIAWAAGFLEGEGSFYGGTVDSRKGCPSDGRTYQTYTVQCYQVQREPLDRLRSMFGGRIQACPARDRFASEQPYFMWRVNGARARGVMLTTYALMSPRRREQIQEALRSKELVPSFI